MPEVGFSRLYELAPHLYLTDTPICITASGDTNYQKQMETTEVNKNYENLNPNPTPHTTIIY